MDESVKLLSLDEIVIAPGQGISIIIKLYDKEGRLLVDDNEIICNVKFAGDQDLNSRSAILPNPEGVSKQGIINLDVNFRLVPDSNAFIEFELKNIDLFGKNMTYF